MKAKSVSLIGASVAAIVGGSLFFFLPPNDILPEITVEYSPVVAVSEETTNVPAAVITQEKVVEEVPVETPSAVSYPPLYRPVITSPPLGLVSPSSSPAPLPPTPRKKTAILDGVDWSGLLKGMSGGVGGKTLRDGSKDYRGMIGKTIKLPVNWDRNLLKRSKRRNHRRHDRCDSISCRVSGTYNRRR